ncbi:unnamed protein product, partial [Mesorhabditis spiculigera]
MNGAYCCGPCKPRYRRLVDSIYPNNANDGPNGANLNKLTFYASSHPEKLARIGDCILLRLCRDLARLRFNQVRVGTEAMDSLLQCCHSSPSLPQLTERHLKMIEQLLETGIPDMEELGTMSFVKFSNIEESAPSYHRQYDFFIQRFSQMCYAVGSSAEKRRISGVKGIRGLVWKSVTDDLHSNKANIWEKNHMGLIIPSLLLNLHSAEQNTMPINILMDETYGDNTKEENLKILTETCLRELMGKASFGSLRLVIEPVLRYLDDEEKWHPPPTFAIHVFRVILYSIQSKSSYYVIQELIDHLDTMATSHASVRIGIATVLSSIVSIAGTSIGPLLLSIFNSLLKHLRASVQFQQLPTCPSPEDEKTYQETLINAMGDFANALPDYQKVEMMMFTVGNIPSLADERNNRHGDVFLQHVLVKTLLKVATRFRTSYLATIFTDSFLDTLERLALVPDPQVRLITQKIFHTLLDRHDNLVILKDITLETDISDLQLNVEKCSSPDQMFMRKHAHSIMLTLYRAVELMPENEGLEQHANAISSTMLLFCIETGYDESLVELFRLCLAIQDMVLTREQEFTVLKQKTVHDIAALYLYVCASLLGIESLCQHVQEVVAHRRASNFPVRAPDGRSEDYEKGLFNRDVISDCLKGSGKDTSRLFVPFLERTASDGKMEELDADEYDGRRVEKHDSQSMGSSFDLTPPESIQPSRRNTVFSLDNTSSNHPAPRIPPKLQVLVGFPITTRSLIETLKPLDPSQEKEIDRKQTRELLTYLRRTPFEQLAEDIGRQNEEEDSSKMLARILNKKRERMQLRGELKEDHPAADEDDDESVPERRKTFFDIVYPDFVY